MPRIAASVIDAIKSRINFIELVSEQVKLRKTGRSYRGLCPFHSEKTPSFFVHPDKQFFYCFGCGKGGDPIKFVMLRDGLNYVEAVTQLAEKVGIHVEIEKNPEESAHLRDERNGLLEAHQQAADFFRLQLQHESLGFRARQYLAKRKLNAATIEAFGIGFCPPGDTLGSHLIKLGFTAELLAKAGLISMYENRISDRFRNRLMVPIRSPVGQIVGFGGRILDAGEPKYLNSPETPIFQKGRLLFGLTNARKSIQTENYVILVEGYLDVIALAQAGVTNVIAPLGTAVTPDQIRLIMRYCQQLHLLFDGDSAGIRATLRTIELLFDEEFPEIKVIGLPEGKDPDDMVRDTGRAGIQSYLDQAVPALDYLMTAFIGDNDISNPDIRLRCMNLLLPYLQKVTGTARRSLYLSRISEKLSIKETVLLDELGKLRTLSSRSQSTAEPALTGGSYNADPSEELLLWLMLNHPDAVHRTFSLLSWEDFTQRLTRELACEIYKLHIREETISYDSLEQSITTPEIQAILDRLSFPQFWGLDFQGVDMDKNLNDCIQTMLIRKKKQEEANLQRKLVAQRTTKGPESAEDELLQSRLERARERMQYLEQDGRDGC